MLNKKRKRLADKDGRMERRMFRKREQILKRHWMVVWMTLFWLCVPAIGIAVVAAVWRLCAWVVFT